MKLIFLFCVLCAIKTSNSAVISLHTYFNIFSIPFKVISFADVYSFVLTHICDCFSYKLRNAQNTRIISKLCL